jgi:hypothetical protein
MERTIWQGGFHAIHEIIPRAKYRITHFADPSFDTVGDLHTVLAIVPDRRFEDAVMRLKGKWCRICGERTNHGGAPHEVVAQHMFWYSQRLKVLWCNEQYCLEEMSQGKFALWQGSKKIIVERTLPAALRALPPGLRLDVELVLGLGISG